MPHVPLAVSEERFGKSGAGLFGDVVAEIDWSVGEVLKTLKTTGVDENTLVMFISDNGPWMSYGNHAGSALPLREGKGTTWDGGVRVPFLVRWPGVIPEGLRVSAPAMTIDVFPTMVDLLAAPPPKLPIDGSSIWKLMDGTSSDPVQEAYYFYYNRNELHAMRSGNWKLHFPHSYRTMIGQVPGKDGMPGKYDYTPITGLELYDLNTDISEKTDVSSLHPDVVERLTRMANEKRAELGDALQGIEGRGSREPGKNVVDVKR